MSVITVIGDITIDTDDIVWQRVMKQILKSPITGLESESEIQAKSSLVVREVVKAGLSRLGCPNPVDFRAHHDGEEYVLFARYRAGEWMDVWRARDVQLIKERIQSWPDEQREAALEALEALKIHHELN
jgi:hypothetical protein